MFQEMAENSSVINKKDEVLSRMKDIIVTVSDKKG